MSSQTSPQRTRPLNESDPCYAIRAEVKFRIIDGNRVSGSGTGITKAISRSRVLVDSDKPLPPGTPVELSLAWPVRLENRIPLNLVIFGRTVAFEGQMAVDILRYEFRTRPANPGNPQSTNIQLPSCVFSAIRPQGTNADTNGRPGVS